MYSGILGCELRADIYLGVVYYQRLRHMVKDKYQVRSTGPVHQLTQQPIKVRPPKPFAKLYFKTVCYFLFTAASSRFVFVLCENRVGKREVVSVSERWSAIVFWPTAPRSSCRTDSSSAPITPGFASPLTTHCTRHDTRSCTHTHVRRRSISQYS